MPVKDRLRVYVEVCGFMHMTMSRKLLSGVDCIAKEPGNLCDPDNGSLIPQIPPSLVDTTLTRTGPAN